MGPRYSSSLLQLALSIFTTRAYCQDIPRVALFTGYSYTRGLPTSDSVALNGWTAGLLLPLTSRFRIAANVAGYYGSASGWAAYLSIPTPGPNPGIVVVQPGRLYIGQPRVHKYSLLVGPEVRAFQKHGVAFNLLAGAGIAHGSPITGSFLLLSRQAKPELASDFGVAVCLGVSADVRLTHRFSLRVLQPEFVATRLGSRWQRNIRLTSGLVINLTR